MRSLFVLLFIATVAQAQSLSPQTVTDIDALFQSAVDQKTIPGVVAMVASRDQVLYYKSFGMADVAGQRPMARDFIFRERVVTTHARTNGRLNETPNGANITSPVAGDGGLASTAADYCASCRCS